MREWPSRATSRASRESLTVILVGSCKWRRTAEIDVLAALRRQQEVLGPKAARARLVIFARQGFSDELRKQAAEDEVLLV